jgi:hypothetical protein
MNFIEQLQEALLLRLEANTDDLSLLLENRLISEPEKITLKELSLIFQSAGIKSITIENTTIKI